MSQTIDALEKIEQSKFHNLCDAILTDYFEYKGILPIGVHTKKGRTIAGTPDSIIFKGKKRAIVFEYTTNKNFKQKLKKDLEVVKEKIEEEGIKIKEFVFVTSGKRKNINGNSPERYIKEKYGWDSRIIDQEALCIPLDISRYFYLRRKYLDIPFDYFLSREKFEVLFKDSPTRAGHYSQIFFNRDQEVDLLRNFILMSEKRILLIYSNGGIGKTRFIIEAIKLLEKKVSFEKYDFLFNDPYQTKIQVTEHLDELSPENKKISIVILDDAHKIDTLREFQRILLERKNSKIIVSTRSTAKEKVKLDLGTFEIEELALNRLEDEIIYNQLEKNINVSTTKEFLEYVVHYCDGNPLIAEIFSYVINEIGRHKNSLQSITRKKRFDIPYFISKAHSMSRQSY